MGKVVVSGERGRDGASSDKTRGGRKRIYEGEGEDKNDNVTFYHHDQHRR